MSAMFQYNQECALKAGIGEGISQSGAYVGKIKSAEWTVGVGDSKSQFLELSLETDSGTANYLSICHAKRDGSQNQSGVNMINAIMGVSRAGSLSSEHVGDIYVCPELIGRDIGMVLQKVLYTKTTGSGGDGYKFEIRAVFHHQTKQTIRELVSKEQAKEVDKILESLRDRDDRKQTNSSQANNSSQQSSQHPQSFNDDDPFNNVNW